MLHMASCKRLYSKAEKEGAHHTKTALSSLVLISNQNCCTLDSTDSGTVQLLPALHGLPEATALDSLPLPFHYFC